MIGRTLQGAIAAVGAAALLAGASAASAQAPTPAPDGPGSKAVKHSQKIPVDPVDFTGVYFTYQPEGFGFQPAPELTPAADKALKDWRALGAQGITPPTASGRCIPPGIPSLFVRVYPIQILRSPKDIVVLHEYESQMRFIHLDGRKVPDPDDLLPSLNGASVGHWEGKTLVIETVGFKTEVAGLPIQPIAGLTVSPAFKLIERWTLSENGTLLTNEFTMIDPTVFVKPWTTKKRWKKRDDLELMEYTCLNDENLITVDASGKEIFKNLTPTPAAKP